MSPNKDANKHGFSTLPIYTLKLVKEKNLRYPSGSAGNAQEAVAIFTAYLEDSDCEKLAVLMVDTRNRFIGIHLVAIGTLSCINGIVMRDIFKATIAHRASAFLLGHCHPSCDCNPSPEDVKVTDQVVKASKIMGIPLLDHIIVSSGNTQSHFSFFEKGLL